MAWIVTDERNFNLLLIGGNERGFTIMKTHSDGPYASPPMHSRLVILFEPNRPVSRVRSSRNRHVDSLQSFHRLCRFEQRAGKEPWLRHIACGCNNNLF